MQLVRLAFKRSGNDPIAQSFDAVHLGLHQAAPVITTPHFPYPSAQTPACGDSRIAIRKGGAFAYSCIFSWGNNGSAASLAQRFIDCLGVIGTITSQAVQSLSCRNLLQHVGHNRCIAHIIAGHASSVCASIPIAACATDVGVQRRVSCTSIRPRPGT